MTACATHCVVRGAHLASCTRDACDGCQPSPAASGLEVCDRCDARIRHALSACPDLVAHLREHIEPAARVPDDSPTPAGERNPPAPLNVEAAAAADDLHAELASWALLVMEERHVTGPDWIGSDIRPASKRLVDGERVYEDARVVGVRDWHATLAVVRWLFVHLDWMLARPWAGDLCAELPPKVATLKTRFPTEQRPVYLPVPCPACGCDTLRRHAPSYPKAPVTIACDLVGCGHIIVEDSFEWAARVLRQERRA